MPKIKAAIACKNADSVQYVYGPDRLNVLEGLTDLNPVRMTKENATDGTFADTEVIFSTWGMPALTEEELEKLPALKAIFYAAGTTDYFKGPFLKKGILISSAWKTNAIPVAEFTFAQIILSLKNYFSVSAAVRAKKQWYGQTLGRGAYGATVALIGAGAISKRVQEMLQSVNVNVIVVPSRAENRTISLEEAFRTAQIVSNHLPDRDDNVGVFHAGLFESMPENAVFINTGRGRQVIEDDLIAVLKKRSDLTALLDVTYPEPPVPGSELYTMPNIHLSPHIAGSINDEVKRMADVEIEEFKRYRDGLDLENLVEA